MRGLTQFVKGQGEGSGQMNQSKRTVTFVLLTSVALFVAVLAPSVGAHESSWDSRVTIDYGGAGAFKGDIAARDACERGRTVTVFKVTRDGDTRPVGSDRTDSDGNWRVPTDPRPENGRYFARAVGRRTGGYGHNHRCEGDTASIEL